MNTVLLPTDFSQNSYNAIKYALNLFKYEECRFVLVNAYQTPKAGAAMMISIEDLLQEESQNELRKLKTKLSKELYSAVMDIETESHRIGEEEESACVADSGTNVLHDIGRD